MTPVGPAQPALAALLLTAALAVLPLQGARGEQDLRVGLEKGRVMVSLAYSDPRAGEVLAALEEGLAAEIQFQLRLYRRQRWPFAFLGDRLVSELRLVRTARYDRFERRYRLESPGAAEARFTDSGGFLEDFFRLGPLALGTLAAAGRFGVLRAEPGPPVAGEDRLPAEADHPVLPAGPQPLAAQGAAAVRSFRHGTTATGLLVLLLIFLVLLALIVVFFQQILAGLAVPEPAGQPGPVRRAGALSPGAAGDHRVPAGAPGPGAGGPAARGAPEGAPAAVLRLRGAAVRGPAGPAVHQLHRLHPELLAAAGIGESLAAGLDLSLAYYHGLVENLARFNSSPLVPVILQDLGRNPERLWKNVQTANSQVHFIQVFDGDGREVLFRGQREGRLRAAPPEPGLPRQGGPGRGQSCCATRPCTRPGGGPTRWWWARPCPRVSTRRPPP